MQPTVIDLRTGEATVAFFKGPSGEEIEFFQTH